ncbi:DNA-binding protein [Endozoicomonas sp.]|uniref:DNA-binding protein n=1 Tax=Endozoicomonas sp. TaxID=1892382 RepID=UPI0028864A6D|nr:DNA-binding protein [Endozoicomonas sp.]
MAVDKDAVFQAAETLVAKGIKPTMEKVREVLGGGSYATINPLLRGWRDTQGGNASAMVVELPSEIRSAIERSGVLLRGEACKIASKRVIAAEERLNEMEIARQKEEEQFESEILNLEEKIAAKDAKIARLGIGVSVRDGSIRALELEITKLTAQSETALLFRPQLQAVNERLEKMESEQQSKAGSLKSE